MTAGAMEEDRQQCLAAGMDAVLTKPINVPAVVDTLKRYLPADPLDGGVPGTSAVIGIVSFRSP